MRNWKTYQKLSFLFITVLFVGFFLGFDYSLLTSKPDKQILNGAIQENTVEPQIEQDTIKEDLPIELDYEE